MAFVLLTSCGEPGSEQASDSVSELTMQTIQTPTEADQISKPVACADVIAVEAAQDGTLDDGTPTFRFDVTIASADTGWDKYADRWQVLDADGAIAGERVLTHPHVDEQPFTRSQSAIPVPAWPVMVKANDSIDGFCGVAMTVDRP